MLWLGLHEEAVEVDAPPMLNLQMVVAHSAAVEGWGGSLLAVAVAGALELQSENRNVEHAFMVELMWVCIC